MALGMTTFEREIDRVGVIRAITCRVGRVRCSGVMISRPQSGARCNSRFERTMKTSTQSDGCGPVAET